MKYEPLKGFKLPANYWSLLLALGAVVAIIFSKGDSNTYQYVMLGVSTVLYLARAAGIDTKKVVEIVKVATGTDVGVPEIEMARPEAQVIVKEAKPTLKEMLWY